MKKFIFIIMGSLSLLIPSISIANPTSIDLATLPSWTGTSSSNNVTTGGDAAIGDFNCDGTNDIILSSAAYGTGRGRIYVVYGNSGLETSTTSTSLSTANVDVTITGTATNDGIRQVRLTDVNADGCDDIIALGDYDGTNTDTMYVFLGAASGWTTGMDADTTVYNKLYTSTTGGSYDYLHLLGPLDGDVTGDGVTNDLDNWLAMCSVSTRSCYLISVANLTSPGTIESLSDFQITRGYAIAESIASGDLDADGNEDLIVGESGDYYGTDQVNIFFGPLSASSSLQNDSSLTPNNYFEVGTVSGTDIVIRDADTTKAGFGNVVLSAPIFGSSHDDIIVGNFYEDNTSYVYAGTYHIISGESLATLRASVSTSTGIEIYNDTTTGTYNYNNLNYILYSGDADQAQLGWAYNAFAGADYNGDNQVDLALGGEAYSPGSSYTGILHVIFGNVFETLVGSEYHLSATLDNSDYYLQGAAGDYLATNVIGGDVTGDGLDDLLVTASGANSGYGATYLWVGAVTDSDGDGDASATDFDSDGIYEALDCNDKDVSATANTWYPDSDGDGFGDASLAVDLCNQPSGYVTDSTDCDDTDVASYPGAAEIEADGIDQDCDGADAPASGSADADADGYTVDAGDCDDADATVYPDATELGDALDNNCDGRVDERLLRLNLTGLDTPTTAGGTINLEVSAQNSSGIEDYDVEILIADKSTAEVTGGVVTAKRLLLSCIFNDTGCTLIGSDTAMVTNDGSKQVLNFTATIPADTSAGTYPVYVRFVHQTTGDVQAYVLPFAAGRPGGSVSPLVTVN